MKRIVDCHVNIWNPDQLTELWRGQMARMRPDCMDRLVHAVEDLQLKSQAYRKASAD